MSAPRLRVSRTLGRAGPPRGCRRRGLRVGLVAASRVLAGPAPGRPAVSEAPAAPAASRARPVLHCPSVRGPRARAGGARMIFHGYYADVPADEVDRFVRSQELGRLVTVGEDGTPHVGLYPFVVSGDLVELHIVREDEQAADLRARPRCVFEVDEVLAVIPSYWVHPEYAGAATAYHRTAIFECLGSVSEEPEAVAAQQLRLLAKHQEECGFRSLAGGDPLYAGHLARLAALGLQVLRRRVKFKLGQNRPVETRRRVIAELRKRGRPNDARAADALEWTIARSTPPST